METSISQIGNFESCPLKWAYGAVHGIWTERGEAATAGIDVHQHIENYCKFGQKFEDSPFGRLAALSKPWLPDSCDSPLIEEKLKLEFCGHTYKMAVDAAWVGPGGAVMNDYKSVKHYRYALTGPRLRSDLQACAYALKLIQLFNVETVSLRWIYLQRPPPDAGADWQPNPKKDIRVIETVIDEDDARAVLRTKQATIDKMAAIKERKLPILDITRNEGNCSAYGGCGYRGHCFPGKFDVETGKPA